ncbi:type II/IV secretion system ATPase subunit [Halapricum hydrolyticum]|uniref:Type II/IV secretion system ATPase subunit n=1 Tax=Halapricum hydrolyticum TaxID=2979991 RepID=A0AAE3LE22_9EURY|nr:type II/IV secretion system ATPase subunit [Halapricum hydrolyticum]MCU4716588.1 type II/IV secretion system ATPase subunit [Halapricum hydrolyticum]MCU4725807.1 type II/IV secretion system ATPase subunit [Halapricum hydrolyticum]
MAIDDTDGGESEGTRSERERMLQNVSAGGEYDWTDFRREFHDGGRFDRSKYLGFDPHHTGDRFEDGATAAKTLNQHWESFLDVETTPVAKGRYFWEHFKREYYYKSDGEPPRDGDGNKVPFEPEEYLGFNPDETEQRLSGAQDDASALKELVDERTVDVNEELDEDDFFSTPEGHTTVVNRYHLEKAVPVEKKKHFDEVERYWVNKPYACAIVFHSRKENERKYYVVQPYLNPIEEDVRDFLAKKLRTAIKYADDEVAIDGSQAERANVIQRETEQLLDRYDLYSGPTQNGVGQVGKLKKLLGMNVDIEDSSGELEGIKTRPEPAVLADDPKTLTEYQVEKLLYYLKRDFIGYSKIDPIKHDINVEDVSCDGYNSRVFVYHTEYENIISNVEHGRGELDDFVVKLAQRSGKGISKRQPQVDATLPDGSRAQLTLGKEVSDHGTNYTIRQFKDVPFTPIDLINWNTFSLDEMAFLWLCIENNKSMIFAGGTASGKTTSLNAISLFIPSNSKIVSIEDTREVELPQRNWVASVTRPSFGQDDTGDVDEFDLLEAALRQRPDYIVMGEVRGEEGRTLFQVMSTGHTTYTTFHADSVGEVIKRFTTDPINVSKTLFTALDLVSIQTQTRVGGSKVRRNKTLTEINEYTPENDEINVRDVYQWQADTDQFIQMGNSNTLEEIKFDRGWDQDRLDEELFKRKVVLAYLIEQNLNTYTQVAATLQAFINDPDTIMTLIANDQLERSLEDLREMESVQIEVDAEKEELVPRPDPTDEILGEAEEILDNADPLFRQLRSAETSDIVEALTGVETQEDVTVEEATEETDFGQFVPKAGAEASEEE